MCNINQNEMAVCIGLDTIWIFSKTKGKITDSLKTIHSYSSIQSLYLNNEYYLICRSNEGISLMVLNTKKQEFFLPSCKLGKVKNSTMDLIADDEGKI